MDPLLPIGSLIGIWLLVATIPGPNFVAVTQWSKAESGIDGFFIALGVSTGAGIWATASLPGLGVCCLHCPHCLCFGHVVRPCGVLFFH